MARREKIDQTQLEELKQCATTLADGGLILIPSVTGWVVGCDASNANVVKRMATLKKNNNPTEMTCLVAHQAMLERHLSQVPEAAYDIIDLTTKPTTLIYDNPKQVAPNLISVDGTLPIRVVTETFCRYLIQRFGKPLACTPADFGNPQHPTQFNSIPPEILKGVDYVVTLHPENTRTSLSSIIKLANDGTVKVIRE